MNSRLRRGCVTGILRAMRLPRLLPTLLLLASACTATTGVGTGTFAAPDAGVTDVPQAQPDVPAGPDVPAKTAPLPDGPPIELVTNKQYLQKAFEVIHSAQARLDIVQFETKTGESVNLLISAVIAAKQRGVVVRVLLDDEIADNATLVKSLNAQGIQAKLDNTKTRTHAKVIASEQGFVVGSTNWSASSIDYNNEANVLVRDPVAGKALKTYLDTLWKTPSKAPIKITYDAKALIGMYGDGTSDAAAGYAAVVGPLLDAAKTRVILVTYGMNVDLKDTGSPVTKTVKKLEAAVKRGVAVQVLMDLTADGTGEGNEVNAAAGNILKSLNGCPSVTPVPPGACLEVRNDPSTVITHAKFLIVDDTLILGTNNWGYMGFVLDHELGVRSNDAKVLGNLLTYFKGIWDKSSPL
jgi:phosphatidylserine/phosphatidylglycerophosphate/cardiolipin synthase-like enzyme